MVTFRRLLVHLGFAVALLLPLSLANAFEAQAATDHGLTLVNGWTNSPVSTSSAGVTTSGGIVSFKGAIAGGSTTLAFTLPAAYRPATNVFVHVDMCGASNGRLNIAPSGAVSVQAES